MKIQDMAYARSSDKGDHVDISLFTYTEDCYQQLKDLLSAEQVRTYFAPMGIGIVERWEVPGLMALKFVIQNALDGGGSHSIRADNQGKTWSGALLRLAEHLTIEKPRG
ncbi:MAG: AtuA-related protein [Sulfobacillus sp.]